MGTLAVALLAVAALGAEPACSGRVSSITVQNRTDEIIRDVKLVVGDSRDGMGSIAPRITRTIVYDGGWPKSAKVEWTTGEKGQEQRHEKTVSFEEVPSAFDGTVWLEVHTDGSIKLDMEPRTPGLRP